MHVWMFIAVVLGLVEGLTEFIPVSSTGHLILAENLLDFHGPVASAYAVFIQLGAVLAVVVVYRHRFARLLAVRSGGVFAGIRGLVLLLLTTLPAMVVGLAFHEEIFAYLFNPRNVAVGLAVGGAWILLAERFLPTPSTTDIDLVTWKEALYVGLFQCLSLWPGMSRSASTILGGMIVGLDRKTAAEYSFFAAVPMMVAACAYDLRRNAPSLTLEHVPFFAVGLAVAFLSAWLAVRFLVRFVSHHTLAPFGWYRLAVAAVVFWLVR